MVVDLDTQAVIYIRVLFSSFFVNGGKVLALIRRYFVSKRVNSREFHLCHVIQNIEPQFGLENF